MLVGYHTAHRCWYVCDEWMHDGRASGPRKTEDKVRDMVELLTDSGRRKVSEWVIDPAEDGVRVELRRGGHHVIDAENDRKPTGCSRRCSTSGRAG